MKIVVHKNNDSNKSYLLNIDEAIVTKETVRQLIDRNDDSAVRLLEMYAGESHELSFADIRRAENVADFVLSQRGYSAERLI